MRYNNYENDGIENNDPMWAICSRGDLSSSGAAPFGCYDTKVSNLTVHSLHWQMAINVYICFHRWYQASKHINSIALTSPAVKTNATILEIFFDHELICNILICSNVC